MKKDLYGSLDREKTIQSMGGFGAVIIDDTAAHDLSTKHVVLIKAITETVFATLTCDGIFHNDLTTEAVAADYGTLPIDSVIMGEFSAIKLTSGSVICYF